VATDPAADGSDGAADGSDGAADGSDGAADGSDGAADGSDAAAATATPAASAAPADVKASKKGSKSVLIDLWVAISLIMHFFSRRDLGADLQAALEQALQAEQAAAGQAGANGDVSIHPFVAPNSC
jgi:hypothetical protein